MDLELQSEETRLGVCVNSENNLLQVLTKLGQNPHLSASFLLLPDREMQITIKRANQEKPICEIRVPFLGSDVEVKL